MTKDKLKIQRDEDYKIDLEDAEDVLKSLDRSMEQSKNGQISEMTVDELIDYGVVSDLTNLTDNFLFPDEPVFHWEKVPYEPQYILKDGAGNTHGHIMALTSRPGVKIVIYPAFTDSDYLVYSMPSNWLTTLNFDEFLASGSIVPEGVQPIQTQELAIDYILDGVTR